jgi:hypothetical protein
MRTKNTFTCTNCGHFNNAIITKKSKDKNIIPINFTNNICEAKDFPICVQIKHWGYWMTDANGYHYGTTDKTCERNSIRLTDDCLLYVYKIALRHLLLSMKIISPHEIDAGNLVPHIKVRNNKDDAFSKYDIIQEQKYIIGIDKLSAKNDFLIMELDAVKDLHFTLIYSKKIGKKINLIDALKKVIKVLNTYPELVNQYSNLTYFGNNCHDFWYNDATENYPFNINPPEDYKSETNLIDIGSIKISPAGSIL